MTHILIVEDNEMNREMVCRRLEIYNFTTSTAADGQQAIDKAKDLQPDIILMDMSLPVINGWDATQQLKADIETKHIPIIGLSAYAGTSDIKKGMDAGCDDYEIKPIDFDLLVSKINTLIA